MGQPIDIRPIHSSKEMMQFIKYPWKIYGRDPHWVPPLLMDRKKFLNRKKNPFFRKNPTEFYLAYRNGEIVGRIAAIINKAHNEFHKDKTGFFGFLECENDAEIAGALLNEARAWLKQRGCDKIMGPMNPSTNDECGFLLDGFDSPPFFMMTHTHRYYIDLMEQLGYRKAKDLYAYIISEEMLKNSRKLDRVSAALEKKHKVSIRTVDMKHFNRELELVREIYNDAWAPNWGFVPMTPDEFDYIANDFKQIIDPEITLIGEYDGQAVGFLLALPNYNKVFKKLTNGRLFPFGIFTFLKERKKIDNIRIVTLGIKQKYQPLGLGAIFYKEIVKRGLARGYKSGEMSWVLEDNDLMNRAAKLLGGEVHKTYRIYEDDL